MAPLRGACREGSDRFTMAEVKLNYGERLEHTTKHAQSLLDKLQFTEAQTVYQEVLRLARDNPPTAEGTLAAERATVTAVSGLAESFARQARNLQLSSCENDQTGTVPWLQLNMQVCSYVILHSEL